MADLSGYSTEELLAMREAMGLPERKKSRAKVVPIRPAMQPPVENAAQYVMSPTGIMKPRAVHNFTLMIREKLGPCLAWNEIANTIYLIGPPPWARNVTWKPRKVDDNDVTQVISLLERNHLSPKANEAISAMALVAAEKSYHPVRDYLARLVWDGVPRVPSMAIEYLNAPDVPIFSVFVTKWLISAVARVFNPGCKADCMLVLEGDQGTMKSTMLRVLATVDGVEYFTDDMHDIETRDGSMQLNGVWIAEVAELNAIQKKGPDSIKAWLSRQTDRYRPPWGRLVADYPRQCAIAGTLNPSDGFLRDSTGARRFWPVPVRGKIDLVKVEADRDQIWAEVVAMWREGVQWYLTDEEVEAAKGITDERYEEDPWAGRIDWYVREHLAGTITLEGIIRMLEIPSAQQHQGTSRRVGAQLRRLGYVKRKSRHSPDGYEWTLKSDAPPE